MSTIYDITFEGHQDDCAEGQFAIFLPDHYRHPVYIYDNREETAIMYNILKELGHEGVVIVDRDALHDDDPLDCVLGSAEIPDDIWCELIDDDWDEDNNRYTTDYESLYTEYATYCINADAISDWDGRVNIN